MLLLLFALALLVRRRRVFAAVALVGAVISAVPLAAYIGVPTGAAEAGPESAHFRLVSLNIWFRNDDVARIARYLEGTRADVIVLQEVSESKAIELQAQLPSFPHAYVKNGRRYGAVVFSRWPLVATEDVQLSVGGVRASRVALDWRHRTITLLGVHLRWPMGPGNSALRNRDLRRLAELARDHDGPLVIAGDFNVTPWSVHFQQTLAASGMNDCSRGMGLAPTWPAPFPPLGISIDHCLASKQWHSVNVETGPYIGSDHRALIVDLELEEG